MKQRNTSAQWLKHASLSAAASQINAPSSVVDAQEALRDESGEWVATVEGNGHHDEQLDGATAELDLDGAGEEALDEEEEYEPREERRPQGMIRRRPAYHVSPEREAQIPGMLERYQPGSLPYAIGYLLRNPQVLVLGLAIAGLIYIALYTSLFTNINGIGTGLFGSIGYWIAQQDVRRGDQPWFFYILLIPLYDILPVIFGFAGMILFAVRGLRSLIRRRDEPAEPDVVVPGATSGFNVGKRVDFAEFRPFAVLFLSAWFIGVFLLYSWAGEKMPWLTIHMVQPLIFLAALFLGNLVTTMIRHRRERELEWEEFAPEEQEADGRGSRKSAPRRRTATLAPWVSWSRPTSWVPFVSYVALFALLAALFAMNISLRVMKDDYADWWQLLVWPALMIVLTAFYWAWVGGSRVLRYLAVAGMVVLLVYTFRSAIELSYYNQDTPREMLVYVQTSPDVTRLVEQVDRLSIDQTGGKDLKVMYDSETSWPMEWYFRDYKNKIFNSAGPTTAPADDVAVMVVHPKFYDQQQTGDAPQLDNYIGTKYVMRWWFPEETYRQFIPDRFDQKNEDGTTTKSPLGQAAGFFNTIFYTLSTPSEQGKLWKFLIWRQPYAPLGSTDLAIFVRKDLFNRYNFLAQLDLPNYERMSR